MTQRTLTAFWLSLLGGLWMLLSGRFMYGSFTRLPGRSPSGWGHPHMLWGRGMMGYFGLDWPWVGLIEGAIVIVSYRALCLSSLPSVDGNHYFTGVPAQSLFWYGRHDGKRLRNCGWRSCFGAQRGFTRVKGLAL